MLNLFLGAAFIALMRVCDVTIGTFRTLLVVQGRKYLAAVAGFFEVSIWLLAMRYIFLHLDNVYNFIGYATGFALGNILGITLEQKVALGYVQVNIVSRNHSAEIASKMRDSKFGVTILPAEGKSGELSILFAIIKRKNLDALMKITESIDKRAFVTVQASMPFRGFIHGSRV